MTESPEPVVIRDATPEDFATVLLLNEADVVSLSPLGHSELEQLAAVSSSFRVAEAAGRLAGFLIAISSDSEHHSVNFRWFKQRYARFIYIDRVVVAAHARRWGVASRLYADLEAHAALVGAPLLTCEVNLRPSNPASLAFHERTGFEAVSAEERDGGAKTVSMLIKRRQLV